MIKNGILEKAQYVTNTRKYEQISTWQQFNKEMEYRVLRQ